MSEKRLKSNEMFRNEDIRFVTTHTVIRYFGFLLLRLLVVEHVVNNIYNLRIANTNISWVFICNFLT